MAEFTEVMRHGVRMCASYGECEDCPLEEYFTYDNTCPFCIMHNHLHDVDKIAQTICTWAAEHPELRYPTWKEWWTQMFPSCEVPCVTLFGMDKPTDGCWDCDKCIERPIPADIAEKLGIKPIGGKGE